MVSREKTSVAAAKKLSLITGAGSNENATEIHKAETTASNGRAL